MLAVEGQPATILRWALGALGVWLVAYIASLVAGVAPESGLLFGRESHLILDFGAGAVCAVAALYRRGRDRAAWLLVAGGILAWAAGDVYWTAALSDADAIPVPSPADLGYLAFPLLCFAGLAGILRS